MEKREGKEKVDSVISQLDFLFSFFTSIVFAPGAPRSSRSVSVDLAAPVWSSLRFDDIGRASRKEEQKKRKRQRKSRFRSPTSFFFGFVAERRL